MACQKSRISQRRINHAARFQIHSAPSPTMTTIVLEPSQPSSRNCPYKRWKISSASPRQLTRKRRTTERRPGDVSTRSSGKSKTPVFTSRKWPSSTGGNGGNGSVPLCRRRRLRTCMPDHGHVISLYLSGDKLKRMESSGPAAIHAHQNSGRSFVGGSACAATIGVIPAQCFAVIRNCLPQPLRHFPDTHRTDLHAQKQFRQTRRQSIRHYCGQHREVSGERTADASRFHTQKIQQRSAFGLAARTTVTRYPNPQASDARQPRNQPHILANHDSLALRANRRLSARGFRQSFHRSEGLRVGE